MSERQTALMVKLDTRQALEALEALAHEMNLGGRTRQLEFDVQNALDRVRDLETDSESLVDRFTQLEVRFAELEARFGGKDGG